MHELQTKKNSYSFNLQIELFLLQPYNHTESSVREVLVLFYNLVYLRIDKPINMYNAHDKNGLLVKKKKRRKKKEIGLAFELSWPFVGFHHPILSILQFISGTYILSLAKLLYSSIYVQREREYTLSQKF